MTAPKGYVKRTPITIASADMLRILIKTSSQEVKLKALAELERRGESA